MSYQDDLDWLARNAKSLQPEDDLTWLARNVHHWHKDGARLGVVGRENGYPDYRFPLSTDVDHGFTREQWIARRAELQHKPSWKDAPEWAEWLAQDSYGRWGWFQQRPVTKSLAWFVNGGNYHISSPSCLVIGCWQDTLEQRHDIHKTTEEIDTSAECAQEIGIPVPVGHKADHGKPIMGAIPPHAELAVARVLTFGAEKYARDGWQVVENAEVRYMDAALRHLNAHRRGELVDDESGESHLAHAACCILFMLDMQEREGPLKDGE